MEEELWYDIKKAKTGFVPNHAMLSNEKEEVITSEERPDRLADHFELKQWAIDHDRCKNVRTRKIFAEAGTDTGRITVEQLRITINKFKK